jgi:hypothetical protein
VRPADHSAIKAALKGAIETGGSVTSVAERLRVDIATLAQHADLYAEVRKATRNRKAAADTARQEPPAKMPPSPRPRQSRSSCCETAGG